MDKGTGVSIRKIDNLWMESDCPECGHTFRWLCEHKNKCPECGADYGFMVNLKEGLKCLPPLEGTLWILEEKVHGKWRHVTYMYDYTKQVPFERARSLWDNLLNDDTRIRPGSERDLEEIREWYDWMLHIE